MVFYCNNAVWPSLFFLSKLCIVVFLIFVIELPDHMYCTGVVLLIVVEQQHTRKKRNINIKWKSNTGSPYWATLEECFTAGNNQPMPAE